MPPQSKCDPGSRIGKRTPYSGCSTPTTLIPPRSTLNTTKQSAIQSLRRAFKIQFLPLETCYSAVKRLVHYGWASLGVSLQLFPSGRAPLGHLFWHLIRPQHPLPHLKCSPRPPILSNQIHISIHSSLCRHTIYSDPFWSTHTHPSPIPTRSSVTLSSLLGQLTLKK